MCSSYIPVDWLTLCGLTYIFSFLGIKPLAQLVENYDFGLPLNTIEELDNIERNLHINDNYASSLV